MKKFGFLFFLMAMVFIALSSSTCRPDPPKPIDLPCDTCNNNNPNNPPVGSTGKVTITVRLYTDAGFPAGGANVGLAYTLDSAQKGIYAIQTSTDGNGVAVFPNLYARTKIDSVTYKNSRYYYFDAWQNYAGDSLTTTGDSNPYQHKELELKPNQERNERLVIMIP